MTIELCGLDLCSYNLAGSELADETNAVRP